MKYAVQISTPALAPAVPDAGLRVHVVYLQVPATMRTLTAASSLAEGLRARVTVHIGREIPYPLPLKSPPVPVAFTEERLLRLAAGQPVETSIQVYLCRDLIETIRHALYPESVVLIAGRKHWWPTREERLARALRRDGHRVILSHAD